MGQDRETLHRDALCVRDALIRASRVLPDDTEAAIASAAARGGKAESVMAAIRTNLQIAREKGMPMCQDTGAFWCLASIGRSADVRYALSNSLGFGGHNGSLLFKKWEA